MDTRGQEVAEGRARGWRLSPLPSSFVDVAQGSSGSHTPPGRLPYHSRPLASAPPPRHPRPDPEQEAAVPWVCRRSPGASWTRGDRSKRGPPRVELAQGQLVCSRKTRARGGVGWGAGTLDRADVGPGQAATTGKLQAGPGGAARRGAAGRP